MDHDAENLWRIYLEPLRHGKLLGYSVLRGSVSEKAPRKIALKFPVENPPQKSFFIMEQSFHC
jgi:hypothetical protein